MIASETEVIKPNPCSRWEEGITPLTDWEWTMYGEYRSYAVGNGGANFEKAAEFCEKEGGHLPFVENKEENEEIRVMMRETVRLITK